MQDDEPAVWARRAGLRRAGRRRAHARRASSPRSASSRTRPGRCCRTSARTRGRRRAGCGCSAPRARSSSRSSFSTTASPPSPCPPARPISRPGDPALARSPGDGVAEAFAGRQLLIADGHHRYETAVAVRGGGGDAGERADDGRARLDLDPGSRSSRRTASSTGRRSPARPAAATREAASSLAAAVRPIGRRVLRRRGRCRRGRDGRARCRARRSALGHEGSGTRPRLDEAVARVDSGEADGAFLLRATRIEDVFERARRGEVMPQKTTYFFPKLTERPPLPSRMTADWLALCRACVADIEAVLEALPTRAEREPVLRAGEGGDDTTAIDAAAEDAVVARLEALARLHPRLGGARRADVRRRRPDARRRRPDRRVDQREAWDPVLLALARRRRRADARRRRFGFVYDFGAGEEWVGGARRRSLAERRPLDTLLPRIRSRSSPSRGRRPSTSPSGRRHGRSGGPAPRDGLARPLPLPSRRRARRRRLLAEAGALDRHRRGTAARARARPRDRALRGSAVRGAPARSRGSLAGRRGGDTGALLPRSAQRSRAAAPSAEAR